MTPVWHFSSYSTPNFFFLLVHNIVLMTSASFLGSHVETFGKKQRFSQNILGKKTLWKEDKAMNRICFESFQYLVSSFDENSVLT